MMEYIQSYTISIFATALLITVVDILSPTGAGGVTKHLRFLTSLVFVCLLISPTVSLAQKLGELADGKWTLGENTQTENDYNQQMQNALDSASKQYFAEMLTMTLCQEFEIAEDNIRAHVEWIDSENGLRPQKVTLLLSGKAIWKNPARMEEYVSSLLECDCVSAIE